MAELTLRQAATQVGVSRQTVYRLVKQGRLSATVRGDGQKVVDPAELLRVFGRLTPATGETVSGDKPTLQRETPPATGQAGPKPSLAFQTAEDRRREVEIAGREALRAELAAARDALQRADEQLAEAKAREAKLLDLLSGQTRLLEHKAEVEAPPPRGFWRRLRGK